MELDHFNHCVGVECTVQVRILCPAVVAIFEHDRYCECRAVDYQQDESGFTAVQRICIPHDLVEKQTLNGAFGRYGRR